MKRIHVFPLLAILALLVLPTQAATHLRERRIQGYTITLVPFGVTVKIGKGSANSGRQPTSTDYDGVNEAVMTWFDDNSNAQYSADPATNFLATQCSIGSTNDVSTTDPSYEHEVSLSCEAKFEHDPSGSSPSALELMQTATTYSIGNFIANYLNPAVAADSAFQSARRASLGMVYMSSSGAGSNGSGNGGGNNGVGTPMPTPGPTSAPVPMPPTLPLPVPMPTSSPDTEPIVHEPIIIKWTLGKPNGIDLREPTETEWDDLVTDTQNYIHFVFNKTYNVVDVDGLLPEFVSLENTTVVSKNYDDSAARPYEVVVDSMAVFKVTEGTARPPMFQWVYAIHIEGLSTFRNDFLNQRTGSIFENPTSLQWRALE
ncbi:expressed unknown protein [Seminavis robusta]|uniref:Uncharacterized protein n=1 Tax=Seminavis robusta TaxID=568900 RepID=A0A9N8HCV8_9STRA|nr:expressed unknown protein [Seminavis robusta]|eukprot:Sro430_g141350.1 n/a (372) ;mRNA; r:43492-44607